jgi:type II restriction/modification system DNA methylase subunit YeeA
MSSVGDAIASITPLAFIKKWKRASLTERQTAQEHFIDLCALFGHPTPTEDDPTGDHFAFEKGATKIGGGRGFADVWKKDYFAWEYKRKNGNLDDALLQLIRYAPALESPPLQVVCDLEHFRIHTAWTNTVPARYEIKLDDLADADHREILRNVFYDPEKLKPTKTRAAVTKEAADKFSTIALRLQGRGSPEEIAHFVNQLVFCFFAHSVKLLPEGLFPKLLRQSSQKPEKAQSFLNKLFEAMESGGDFDLNDIAWFNGGLFDGRRALPLDEGDIGLLLAAGSLDWGLIDPSIFGTLFERFLDPDKRAQIGAHYTDQEKISKLIEPVIMKPLHEEWAVARTEIKRLLSGDIKPPMRAKKRRRMTRLEAAEEVRSRYLERLRNLQILDPACGSGNFLYLALQGVKDIENKANLECEMLGLNPRLPIIGPEIVRGIEINPLAAELARTTVWIGDIQWRLRNGIHAKPKPILRKLDAIECRDALITGAPTLLGKDNLQTKGSRSNSEHSAARYLEAVWPMAEFIVGNPPFLGDRRMIAALGENYVESLRHIYSDRLEGRSDFVCYWFAKALDYVKEGQANRVGLVATNSISGGNNFGVMRRIASEGKIFEAWSDESWVVEGAAVRVALVCFSSKREVDQPRLDGQRTTLINPDLTSGISLASVKRLSENANISFIGTQKNGPFDIPGELARSWIRLPHNPNDRPNSDVLRPWTNGSGIVRRDEDRWIIDFGTDATEREASLYEAPFEFVFQNVKPTRIHLRRKWHRTKWWLHGDPRPALRVAVAGKSGFITTPLVSKHRIFVRLPTIKIPENTAIVIAKDDYTTFGILHSRFHEAWSLRLGTWLGVGNDPRYTPTTTFETFPFPESLTPDIPSQRYADDPRALAIARAARRLDELRNAWLNPPALVRVEPDVVPGYPHRILPKDTISAAALRERTLTNLYNQRPQWLVEAHRDLDAAVATAYGWPSDISEEDVLTKLLEINLARAADVPPVGEQPTAKRRARSVTGEEARRSPQFKLPIAGGKQATPAVRTHRKRKSA